MENNFKLMGLPSTATMREVKVQFSKLIKENHPDKGGDGEKAKALITARDELFAHIQCRADFRFQEQNLEFRDLLSKSVAEFPRKKFNNNLIDFYTQLLQNTFEKVQQETKQKSCNFFCQLCGKHFANEEHHFQKVINPYVEMVMSSDNNYSSTDSAANLELIAQFRNTFGDAWDFKVENLADMAFWKDTKWEEILPACVTIQKYVEVVEKIRVENVARYINTNLGTQTPLISASLIYNPPCPITLSSIQLKHDRTGTENIFQGKIVKVDIARLGFPLDRRFVPSYVIQDPPKKEKGCACNICKSRLILNQVHNCKVCGKVICGTCMQKKVILHMGFNSLKKICTPCEYKCKEEDAFIWAKEALNCLESSVSNAKTVRLYLYVSHLYIKDISGVPKSLKSLYKRVASVAILQRDFETVVLCQFYQRIEGFSWAYIAQQLAKEGEYKYAMSCLEKISPFSLSIRSEDKNRWNLLGDLLGKFHPQLAMHCYAQCNFDAFEWIGKKASYYEAKITSENQKLYHNLCFLCLKRGFQMVPLRIEVVEIIRKIFIAKKYQLGVYSLKAAGLNEEDFNLLSKRILETTEDLTPNTLIIDYVASMFPHKIQNKIKVENCKISSFIESSRFLNFTKEELIDKVDDVNQLSSLIPVISIITHLNGKENWKRYSQEALKRNKFHAACIFMQLHALSYKCFAGTGWQTLGLQLIENGASSYALVAFLLSSMHGIKNCVTRLDAAKDHEVVIPWCLQTKNLDLLRETGYKLLKKSDLKNALKYYASYIKNILTTDDFLPDTKMETLLKVIEEVFCSPEYRHILLGLKKSILKKYHHIFFQSSAFPIHLEILNEFISQKLPNYHGLRMILAGLHFIPHNEWLNRKTFLTLQSKWFAEEMSNAFYNQDFKSLRTILLQINQSSIPDVEAFIKFHLGQRNMNLFPLPYQKAILLLQGVLEKLKGNWAKSISLLEEALHFAPPKYELASIVADIFVEDLNFHEEVLRELGREMRTLKARVEQKDFESFEGLPILVPDCVPVAAAEHLLSIFEDLEESHIQQMIDMETFVKSKSHKDAGFAYIDLSSNLTNLTSRTITFLIGACHFLQAMELSTDPAESYGYRNIIFQLCTKIQINNKVRETPYFEIYTTRMTLSLLLRCNYLLSIKIKTFNHSQSLPFREEDIIPLNMRHFFLELMSNLIKLLKVSPLIGGGCNSACVLMFRDYFTRDFLECFFEKKSSQTFHSEILQKYLYSFERTIGVMNGWIHSLTLEKAQEKLRKDLYEAEKGSNQTRKDVHADSFYQGYVRRPGLKERIKYDFDQKMQEEPTITTESRQIRIAESLSASGKQIFQLILFNRSMGNL